MKLKVPENVEARTYTVEGDVLKTSRKYEAGDVIPKGEAVVLKDLACDRENPHTYAFVSNTESEEMDTENLLKGFDEAATTTGGSNYYMLTNGDNGVGFYWGEDNGTAFTSAAHKAYLALPGESPIKGFSLEDETTAIETLAMPATGSESQEIYNLAGQRMSRMQKGLNIVNGKKTLVK